jgi:hypothetical protein
MPLAPAVATVAREEASMASEPERRPHQDRDRQDDDIVDRPPLTDEQDKEFDEADDEGEYDERDERWTGAAEWGEGGLQLNRI